MPRKKLSLTQYLEALSANELISEIKELHKLFQPVREFYQVKLSDTGEKELLVKYKKIIKDEFFPDRGFGKMRLSTARKAVSDFSKLSNNSVNIADIMLFYVEMGVEFTNNYGDINEAFYSSMENMYNKTADYITARQLDEKFIERFKQIVRDTSNIGWGFGDYIEETFYSYFPSK